jgi:N-acyl-L-homoserine lactone synthetase
MLLGAQTLVTVSPVGMERLLRVNGFGAKRSGTVMQRDGETIVCLVMESVI